MLLNNHEPLYSFWRHYSACYEKKSFFFHIFPALSNSTICRAIPFYSRVCSKFSLSNWWRHELYFNRLEVALTLESCSRHECTNTCKAFSWIFHFVPIWFPFVWNSCGSELVLSNWRVLKLKFSSFCIFSFAQCLFFSLIRDRERIGLSNWKPQNLKLFSANFSKNLIKNFKTREKKWEIFGQYVNRWREVIKKERSKVSVCYSLIITQYLLVT